MQILSVRLKNIKSHRETELDFSAGINVLSGPNGAGKSTIFEAIGYALFGVDARDFVTRVERFLTIGAKKGEISVTFRIDDGGTYRVTRTVGAGGRWLLARVVGGDFEVEEHAGATETEARIAELLGLSGGRPLAEQFRLVIGPFQNDFLGPFVIRQPTRRQEAFDEILGIDAWRKTFRGTAPLLSAVKEKVKLLAAEAEAKREQVAVLPEKKKELSALKAESKLRRKTLAERDRALLDTQKSLGELDAREKEISSLQNAIQVLENRIRDGESKLADQRQRVAEAENAREALERNRAGKEAFEKAEASIEGLRRREKQAQALEREVATLEKESARLTEALGHERREVEETEKLLAEEEGRLAQTLEGLRADEETVKIAARLPELRRKVEELRSSRGRLEGRRTALLEGRVKLDEGICPFFQEPCRNIAGSPPRDLFTTRVEDLDREMLELDKRLEALGREVCTAEKAQQTLDGFHVRSQEIEKQERALAERREKNRQRAGNMEKLQAMRAGAEQKAAARKEELRAFGGLDKEITRAEKERTGFQGARDAFYANKKDAEEIEGRLQTLEKWKRAFEDLTRDCAAKKEELARLRKSYDPEAHLEGRRQKDRLVAEVATLAQQLEALGKDGERLESEIGKLQKIRQSLEERLAEIKTFEEKERLVTFLRNRVFKNVSARLSERFREEISRRADRIYRTISEADEELYWGENYQVVLRDLAEGSVRERSDDQLSGGQMMSAVVALRLAMLQTIGARIAFFDEPTSNLDASRRENLAGAFRAIDIGREGVGEHWYDQLFLVSHDVAFAEITDQIIEVGG